MRAGRIGMAALWRDGRWMWWAAGLLPLCVQAVFVAETARSHLFAFPLIDSATYHQQALAALEGTTAREPFWQPPLYPGVLALVYHLVGTGMMAVRLVHGLLASAAGLLTLALGRRLAPAGVAAAAALLTAVCGPLVFFFSQLLPAGLATVLLLALLLLFLRAREKPTPGRWLACGLALGLEALTVANALVLLVLLAPAAWGRRPQDEAPRDRRWRLAGLGALLAGVALVILPVTLRNRIAGGEWVPISANGGINFYIGNNPHAEQTLATRPGLDWDRLVRIPWQLGARTHREAERYFWRESLRWACEAPAEFARSLLRKGRQFIAARELPRNVDLYVFRGDSLVLRLLVWRAGWFCFPFSLVGPLALLGMLLYGRRGSPARPVVSAMLLYALSIILFFPASRYRAPLLPLALVFACLGAAWLWRQIQIPSFRWWLGCGALAVFGLAVNRPVAVPTDAVNFRAEAENAVGAALETRGARGPATGFYRRAIQLDPELADAHFNLATALWLQGQAQEALAEYRETLRLRPDHDRARVNLGIAEYELGNLDAAVAQFELALALNPANANAHRNMGVVLVAMGRKEAARRHFAKAAELDPAHRPALKSLDDADRAGSAEGGGGP